MAPIRIQSQALRRRKVTVQTGIFPVLPEATGCPVSPEGSGGADQLRLGSEWHQADVKRAIDAAEEAGLSAYRIDIGPDGTISLIVGDPASTADPEQPCRDPRG